MIRKKVVISLSLVLFLLSGYASAQLWKFQSRSLLPRDIYIITKDNSIETAKYWSLHLGNIECTLQEKFPGEGMVEFPASINMALLSSFYIEGSGYSEKKGKTKTDGLFVVMEGDSLKKLDLEEIDYVYLWGEKVKLKDEDKERDLFLVPEGMISKHNVKKMRANFYKKKQEESLEPAADHQHVKGFSFTKEGALRALKAQKANE